MFKIKKNLLVKFLIKVIIKRKKINKIQNIKKQIQNKNHGLDHLIKAQKIIKVLKIEIQKEKKFNCLLKKRKKIKDVENI